MPLMEIHKHEGGVIELVSEPPKTHIWSQQYVDRETKAGWLEWEGEPQKYEVHPDPNGQLAGASSLKLTIPGDRLVMNVMRNGKARRVVYRVTHYPVPQFFRLTDKNEAEDVRVAPEYGLELIEGGD